LTRPVPSAPSAYFEQSAPSALVVGGREQDRADRSGQIFRLVFALINSALIAAVTGVAQLVPPKLEPSRS
jgi:hypothetical protein